MRTVGLYHRADPIAIMGAFSVLEVNLTGWGRFFLFALQPSTNEGKQNDFSYLGERGPKGNQFAANMGQDVRQC